MTAREVSLTTCPKSSKLLKMSGSTLHHAITLAQAAASVQYLQGASAVFGIIDDKEKGMNLSLLQRPKKINKGTSTMYIYHPSVVTTSAVLEPGDVLHILDVFEGNSTSETTLKVVKVSDWQAHQWGRVGNGCTRDREANEGPMCDCEKELSEMGDDFKAVVHYVLLSDVGK